MLRRAVSVRSVPKKIKQNRSDQTNRERYTLYAEWLDNEKPDVRANALICLIHQTNFLLDRQILALEEQFVTEGGYSEKLAAERLKERQKKRSSDPVPECPNCSKPMVLRTAKSGKNEGNQFWGCSGYPDCRGVAKV